MHILVATDADYVVNDVTAALSGPDVRFTVCSEGREVAAAWRSGDARSRRARSADRVEGRNGRDAWTFASTRATAACRTVKVLMLLDRKADIHLAKRSAADAWLVKPTRPAAP